MSQKPIVPASELACGCAFWGVLAAVVLVIKILFWRAFVRWCLS